MTEPVHFTNADHIVWDLFGTGDIICNNCDARENVPRPTNRRELEEMLPASSDLIWNFRMKHQGCKH